MNNNRHTKFLAIMLLHHPTIADTMTLHPALGSNLFEYSPTSFRPIANLLLHVEFISQ